MPNLTQPLTGPLARGVGEGGLLSFSPRSLFANSAGGAWYDPSDLATLFSDSAGTTAAVVDGPVGKMLDKSGNGIHATQATTSKKPILRSSGGRTWLEFDGVDDVLTPSAALLGSSASSFVAAGCLISAAGTDKTLYSERDGTSGGPINGQLDTTAGKPRYVVRGAGGVSNASSATLLSTVANAVLSGQCNAGATTLRVNGASAATASAAVGVIAVTDRNIGFANSGGTTSLQGSIYGLIVVALAPTATQVSNTERFLANKSGVTLP